MKLAVSNIAWLPQERLHAYRLLAESGIAGLEIAPALFFHTTPHPFNPSITDGKEAMSEIADFGLSIVSMQSLLYGVKDATLFGTATGRANFLAGMRRAIELAGRFGIPNIVFGSPKNRSVPAGYEIETALTDAIEVFRKLGDLAQRVGTKIAIEPNPAIYGTNFLNDFSSVHTFVQRADHPSVVANLDLGAMRINGTYDTITAVIPSLINEINHVHISEQNLSPAPKDVTSLVPLLRSLSESNYTKWISIEMKRTERGLIDISDSIRRLWAAIRLQAGLR